MSQRRVERYFVKQTRNCTPPRHYCRTFREPHRPQSISHNKLNWTQANAVHIHTCFAPKQILFHILGGLSNLKLIIHHLKCFQFLSSAKIVRNKYDRDRFGILFCSKLLIQFFTELKIMYIN